MTSNSASFFKLIGTSLLFVSVLAAQGPGGPGGPGEGGPRGQGGPGGGGPGGRGGPSILQNALDTNHDGKLSAEEISAAPKNLLKLDINGDGQITPDELQPPPETAVASPTDLAAQLMVYDKKHAGYLTRDELPERLQGVFDRADTNHDGKVTPDELRALAAKQTLPTGTQKMGNNNDPIFRALDTNHDGTLSAQEIAAASTSLLTLDKNHDGEIAAAEMRAPAQTPADQADHFLGENDTNHDGKVSKAEAPEWFTAQFDAADKNHDGFLDREELIAYFTANGGGRGGPGGGGPGGPGGGGPGGPGGPGNGPPNGDGPR